VSSRLKLVQGDTRPPVYTHLTDAQGVIDVSGATVRLKFREAGTTVVLQNLVGTLLPGTVEVDGHTPDLSQYPTPGSGGRVKFAFPNGALDIDPGYYEGEIEITYADGSIQTVYHKLKFILREQL
jgi:hypothetical protein